MGTYIALLRGINVGGHRKIKMVELREVLSKNGFDQVQTYIQSGNILFQSAERDSIKLAATIRKLIDKAFGFPVPVLVVSSERLRTILENNPFQNVAEENLLFFTLLKEVPEPEKVMEFKGIQFEGEHFHITEYCVYLSFTGNYRNAKLNNNYIEKKLKVEATTRNLKTMRKLLAMMG